MACHLTKLYGDLHYFVLIPLSRLFYVRVVGRRC